MQSGTASDTSAFTVDLTLSTTASAMTSMRVPSIRRCWSALAVAVSSGIADCAAAPLASVAAAASSAAAVSRRGLS